VKASVAIAILVLAESALLVVPLLPAFDELRRKRDSRPLEVIQKHGGEITYFALGFRNYIAPLQERLGQCVETRTSGWGRLKNGEQYVLLGDDRQPFPKAANLQGSPCRWLIAAGIDVTLPNDLNFEKEIYSTKSLIGGERNAFRAILCDEDIHLREGSETMRWAHACGQFQVDSGCNLYGRVSSDSEILLAPGCSFQRLHAPRILFGRTRENRWPADHDSSNQGADPLLPRRLIDGDVEIRAGEVIGENIVARGRLHVGARARMLGSIKGHRSVVLEEDVEVSGSLISSGELRIGPGCRIGGPILAEHQIEIATGAVCGTANSPTTVSSPVVQAMEGTLFFGTLWARDIGWVTTQA
jgi:cytoskeletal protein CcmA (bactofilin family)